MIIRLYFSTFFVVDFFFVQPSRYKLNFMRPKSLTPRV